MNKKMTMKTKKTMKMPPTRSLKNSGTALARTLNLVLLKTHLIERSLQNFYGKYALIVFVTIILKSFHTTTKPDGLVSLDEYISRMKEDQDTILYLSGDSKDSIMRSPILQKYT